MNNKKNFLRDVLPKSSVRSFIKEPRELEVEEEAEQKNWGVSYEKPKIQRVEYDRKSRKGLWFLALIAVLVLVFAISYVLSKAEIVVTPRSENQEIDLQMKAKLASVGDISDNKGTILNYYPASLTKVDTKSVPADGKKQVTKKATGTITIYNNFSKDTQRLIKNTRFESKEGLIYRIDRSVDVPGKKTVDGKVTLGSIDVVVYADEFGEKYNLDSGTFTIPGFKSDEKRFAGFYAESKTSISGGYEGVTNVLSDAKQKAVRAEMRAEIEKSVLAEANLKVPEGKIFPKGAYTVEFESLPLEFKNGTNVDVKEKAIVNFFAFDKEEWNRNIVSKTIFANSSSTSPVSVSNDNLLFVWKKRPKTDTPEIDFRISGEASFNWIVDKDALAGEVAGKTRAEIKKEIFPKHSEIVSAEAVLTPVWMMHFPESPKKIDIKIK
jgi:hypothetical protein